MKRFAVLAWWILALGICLSGYPCIAEESLDSGKIRVMLTYAVPPDILEKSRPTLQFVLLSDHDDIVSQIEALKEESKNELEPLVKDYMHAAETLTMFAVKGEQTDTQEKERIVNVFENTERRIKDVLALYHLRIDALLQQHRIVTKTVSSLHAGGAFTLVQPGKYRVYAVLRFSTTTLRWFEPVEVKGGGCHTIVLTRENLMNPYWTDLNWWGFMNLDFSIHH